MNRDETGERPRPRRGRTQAGGLVPLLLYGLIVAGWTVEAVAIGAWHLLPLIAWTVPVFVLYIRRMIGRRRGA
ncbi:hypothetical protein Ga0609869_002514 [Rhodovulum iodosum]|uniref:DUF2842 domain-containing protein n=1 Tax=Rhodovulum iodosum TaxID=68291 RepID=A0ABV3XUY4_9RHOB